MNLDMKTLDELEIALEELEIEGLLEINDQEPRFY